jgi:hypothetical protein
MYDMLQYISYWYQLLKILTVRVATADHNIVEAMLYFTLEIIKE